MNLEPLQHYPAPQRRFLLELARRTLVCAANDNPLPEVAAQQLTAELTEERACFVTLTDGGVLRGCIGHVLPRTALYRAVMESTEGAALHDPRFPRVQPEEVPGLLIEISVLTQPQRLRFGSPEELLAQLQPKEHGVLLHVAGHSATFLPQVWEQVSDKKEFLGRLSEKAGCECSAWRGADTTISVYRAECFEERGSGVME